MIQGLLKRLSYKIVKLEDDKIRYGKYFDMQKSEGWKVHAEYLLYLRGMIAEEMLSEAFTNMSSAEKDVCQRAYAMIDKVIFFLLDPVAEARKMSSISAHNQRMAGATKRGATAIKPSGATQ